MKILHYALGFPPYRSGGLTKFCMDLMLQQAKEGHEVAMLWPGRMKLTNKKVKIIERECVIKQRISVRSLEIINPLPVPFDEGINDIEPFTVNPKALAYEEMLDRFQPDIIHVHTLMGIHKSFFEIAKKKKIRMVFTTHDFFPICPKVTMFRDGNICNSICDCRECGECNETALDLKKIWILQSLLYRKLKDSAIVKKMRKQHRDEYLGGTEKKKCVCQREKKEEYKKLRNYYYSILKLVDIIHYNSSVTKKAYESIFDFKDSCIISITHADIRDNRQKKIFNKKQLRIRYLGPQSEAKGFSLLKKALDELWEKNKDFCLDIHFEPVNREEYMKVHARYSYSDLENIFAETDVLVAPSVWYETFGYTVLEALSYGVPVVISGTVGAKDILSEGTGQVIENITAEKLCDALEKIDANQLANMNKAIIERQPIMQIEEMSKKIEEICYRWV